MSRNHEPVLRTASPSTSSHQRQPKEGALFTNPIKHRTLNSPAPHETDLNCRLMQLLKRKSDWKAVVGVYYSNKKQMEAPPAHYINTRPPPPIERAMSSSNYRRTKQSTIQSEYELKPSTSMSRYRLLPNRNLESATMLRTHSSGFNRQQPMSSGVGSNKKLTKAQNQKLAESRKTNLERVKTTNKPSVIIKGVTSGSKPRLIPSKQQRHDPFFFENPKREVLENYISSTGLYGLINRGLVPKHYNLLDTLNIYESNQDYPAFLENPQPKNSSYDLDPQTFLTAQNNLAVVEEIHSNPAINTFVTPNSNVTMQAIPVSRRSVVDLLNSRTGSPQSSQRATTRGENRKRLSKKNTMLPPVPKKEREVKYLTIRDSQLVHNDQFFRYRNQANTHGQWSDFVQFSRQVVEFCAKYKIRTLQFRPLLNSGLKKLTQEDIRKSVKIKESVRQVVDFMKKKSPSFEQYRAERVAGMVRTAVERLKYLRRVSCPLKSVKKKIQSLDPREEEDDLVGLSSAPQIVRIGQEEF